MMGKFRHGERAQCVYCGSESDLTSDHVVPISRWREFHVRRAVLDNRSNIVTSCLQCNQAKGDKSPREWFDLHPEYETRFRASAKYLSNAVKMIIQGRIPEPAPKKSNRREISICDRNSKKKNSGYQYDQDRPISLLDKEKLSESLPNQYIECDVCGFTILADRMKIHKKKHLKTEQKRAVSQVEGRNSSSFVTSNERQEKMLSLNRHGIPILIRHASSARKKKKKGSVM